MPALTPKRAVGISAAVACLVYALSLRNGWAMDDYGLIVRNPAVHSLGAAFRAFFAPYWPPQGDYSPGLWRPLVTLSYTVDWGASGGRPLWFHFTNLLLHGLATALVATVALRWLPPLGVLGAGVVFAVHPLHVEAVANVVGRSEILAAIGLLVAVLAARRYRAAEPGGRGLWLALAVAATGLGLGSKEHAVVTIAVLALDHSLDPPNGRLQTWDLYLAVAALTTAWLFLWRAIAGGLAADSAVTWLKGLTTGQRLAAAIPVQLDVVRLLVWPFDLSVDYGPQVIPIRAAWSLFATLAVVTSAGLVGLGVVLRRRTPAITFGILAGAATYLPTSNLLFASGVMLAERALYFGALAPALAAGWLVAAATHRRWRRAALVVLGAVCAAFVVRTETRIPFWRDSRSVVIEGFLQHPESFSARLRLGDALLQTGDSVRALAQYLVAFEIYHEYSFVPVRAGRLALALGRPAQALELGRRARALSPAHPGPAELLADVFLTLSLPDSAVSVARAVVVANPGNLRALENYGRVLARTHAPAWQQHLVAARLDQALGHLASATARLDSAGAARSQWPGSQGGCWELGHSLAAMQALTPATATEAESTLAARCRESEH